VEVAYGRDLTHNINVKGVWWGCKYAIQSMKKHGKGGSIINVASMVAKVGSAAPQLACMFRLFTNIDPRYGVEGCSSCPVKRIGGRACERGYSSQFTLPGAIEYTSAAELFGYTR
jgi:NAD(P)-dependent dehydrogenase (short-subunit alcohol dehydrogenase family)